MSDHDLPVDHPDDDPLLDPELAPLAALLGEAAVWVEPPADLEDAVVAAIRAEADQGIDPLAPSADVVELPPSEERGDGRARILDREPAEVVPIDRARSRWMAPVLAAAAALVFVAGLGIGSRFLAAEEERGFDVEVALAGTDLAPGAEGAVEVTDTPLGTRLILDVSGLEPAPPGQYYEAWLRQDAEVGVSAGTFHLRGGDGAIELWAGVTLDDYPLITVTIQDEGAGAASSGRVVLRGTVEG